MKKPENDQHEQNSELDVKRIVLAAEIASQLYNEPTFGRVKFQKLVYLCRQAANMNLQDHQEKQPAELFDSKFMRNIEEEFKKRNWFDVEKKFDGAMKRSKYIPLPGCNQYKQYYDTWFSSSAANIQRVIDLFRNMKTDATEIAANIYACYFELNKKEEEITEDRLLELFYEWTDKKKRFEKESVLSAWRWLNEKGLIE